MPKQVKSIKFNFPVEGVEYDPPETPASWSKFCEGVVDGKKVHGLKSPDQQFISLTIEGRQVVLSIHDLIQGIYWQMQQEPK